MYTNTDTDTISVTRLNQMIYQPGRFIGWVLSYLSANIYTDTDRAADISLLHIYRIGEH